ncbi:MAG: sugar ABC transporter permease, partial [Sediminispirochaetaceae bacterium]
MAARNRNWKWMIIFLLPIAAMYIAFFIYPFIFVFISSLMKWNGISPMEFVGFGNYVKMFKATTFQISVRN